MCILSFIYSTREAANAACTALNNPSRSSSAVPATAPAALSAPPPMRTPEPQARQGFTAVNGNPNPNLNPIDVARASSAVSRDHVDGISGRVTKPKAPRSARAGALPAPANLTMSTISPIFDYAPAPPPPAKTFVDQGVQAGTSASMAAGRSAGIPTTAARATGRPAQQPAAPVVWKPSSGAGRVLRSSQPARAAPSAPATSNRVLRSTTVQPAIQAAASSSQTVGPGVLRSASRPAITPQASTSILNTATPGTRTSDRLLFRKL